MVTIPEVTLPECRVVSDGLCYNQESDVTDQWSRIEILQSHTQGPQSWKKIRQFSGESLVFLTNRFGHM